MPCYLLRKHPPHPYRYDMMRGFLEAFTIAGVYKTRAAAVKVAAEKNKRSNYLYTVKRFEGVK